MFSVSNFHFRPDFEREHTALVVFVEFSIRYTQPAKPARTSYVLMFAFGKTEPKWIRFVLMSIYGCIDSDARNHVDVMGKHSYHFMLNKIIWINVFVRNVAVYWNLWYVGDCVPTHFFSLSNIARSVCSQRRLHNGIAHTIRFDFWTMD